MNMKLNRTLIASTLVLSLLLLMQFPAAGATVSNDIAAVQTSTINDTNEGSVPATIKQLGFIETDFSGVSITGTGTYVWKNGDSYSGEWVDGVPSGKGEYHWENGDIYSGNFLNGLPNGTGTATFATGGSYTGDFIDGIYEGIGYFEFPGIGSYTGEFSASMRHGQGVFSWETGEIYDGEWNEDKITGNGKLTTANGDEYEGHFTNGVLDSADLLNNISSGKYSITNTGNTKTDGITYTIKYNNKATYTGEICDNQFHGEGTFTLADGSTLVGAFENGIFMSGKYTSKINYNSCVFTVKDGFIVSAEITYNNGTTYSGEYKNGGINGKGTMKYSTGDVYEGEFENGLKSGQGTYTWTWQGKARYIGSWKNDQMNGSGEYYYPDWTNGYKVVGTFKDGKPDGQCTFYQTQAKSYKTDWINGSIAKIYE